MDIRRHYDHAIKYRCQPSWPKIKAQDSYYSTMFDECYGIAVLILSWANANFPGHQEHVQRCLTPGEIPHPPCSNLYISVISIYTLSDLGVLSNLISSLSLANEH